MSHETNKYDLGDLLQQLSAATKALAVWKGGEHKTSPAIALCIAALRARGATEAKDG